MGRGRGGASGRPGGHAAWGSGSRDLPSAPLQQRSTHAWHIELSLAPRRNQHSHHAALTASPGSQEAGRHGVHCCSRVRPDFHAARLSRRAPPPLLPLPPPPPAPTSLPHTLPPAPLITSTGPPRRLPTPTMQQPGAPGAHRCTLHGRRSRERGAPRRPPPSPRTRPNPAPAADSSRPMR